MTKLNNAKCVINKNYLQELLSLALNSEIVLERELLELTQNKQYSEIEKKLLNIKEKRYLKSRQIYILIIVKALLKLESEPIQKKECSKRNDFFLALINNEFELALKLYEASLEGKDTIKEFDTVYLLLLDINELLSMLVTEPKKLSSEQLTRKRIE